MATDRLDPAPDPAGRYSHIDLFRGLAISLMFFYTLGFLLSDSLPSVLLHNVPGLLRPGDFVLPMFLFAMGMSAQATAWRKRLVTRKDHWKQLIKKTAQLAAVGVALSKFTAGRWFAMDEVMLSAVLLLPTAAVARRSNRVVYATTAGVFALYLCMFYAGVLPRMDREYLGGYKAALFYLPIPLAGLLAMREPDSLRRLFATYAALTALLAVWVSPEKLTARPTFITLSVAVCFALLIPIRPIRAGFFETVGQTPLRYWLLFWLLLGIPLNLYNSHSAAMHSLLPEAIYPRGARPQRFHWLLGHTVAIAALYALHKVSKIAFIVVRCMSAKQR